MIKPNNNEKGVLGKPKSQLKMAFDIPIITTNKVRSAPTLAKKQQPEYNLVIIHHASIINSFGLLKEEFERI